MRSKNPICRLAWSRSKEHHHPGEGEARERIDDLMRISRIGDVPPGLGHLCHEALEKLSFMDPSFSLLTEFSRDIYGAGAFVFLPGQQRHFMKRSFLRTPAARIATTFFRHGTNNRGKSALELLRGQTDKRQG